MIDLEKVLRELSEADREATPSAGVERALLDELRSRRRPGVWRWAAAAVLATALGAGWHFATVGEPSAEPLAAAPQTTPAVSEFYVLDSGRPLDSLETGRLLRVTLPSSAPVYFGLPPLPPGVGVEADVLLGDDGVAHAVRFVY